MDTFTDIQRDEYITEQIKGLLSFADPQSIKNWVDQIHSEKQEKKLSIHTKLKLPTVLIMKGSLDHVKMAITENGQVYKISVKNTPGSPEYKALLIIGTNYGYSYVVSQGKKEHVSLHDYIKIEEYLGNYKL